MYRLAYRNFGTHESLVVNHTVNAGSGLAGGAEHQLRGEKAGAASSKGALEEGATGTKRAAGRWSVVG